MLSLTRVMAIYDNDVYMAYLPLAHVMELIAESLALLYGVPIGYSSPLTMTDKSTKIKQGQQGDATVLRPSIIISVPLVLERIHKALQDKIESESALKKAIFNFALDYKLRWQDRGYDTPITNR